MKKVFKVIFALIIMCLFFGCEMPEPEPGPGPTPIDEPEVINVVSISINNPIERIEIGNNHTLEITISPADATKKDVSWSSSDSNVLEVNNGKLTAKGVGKATITVSSTDGSNVSSQIEVEVYENVVLDPVLEVEGQIELFLGEEKEIVATLSNSSEPIKFESKNSEIASVEGKKVVANKVGETTVTVSAGALSKEVKIIVKANALEISGASSLVEGTTEQYKLLVNGIEKHATWISNESNVATISGDGLLTAITEGSVVIKAIYDTFEEVQMTVEVKSNAIKPTGITLSSNLNDETIYINTKIKLDYEITPANANKNVVFETSDDRTAKVDKDGNVRFYKGGSVVITVRSALKKGVYASITLTSLDYVDPMLFFYTYNVGTVAQQYCENACWDRDPYPITLLAGCISYYYFEPFKVVTSTAYEPGENGMRYSYGPRSNTWYITVHDAGGVSTGQSLANYAKGSARSEEKSWHYSVGSDGIFKGLNEDEAGWHAGDGNREVEWTDTGVVANPLEPHATVTISDDQYWIVAGVKTDIKVTPDNPGATGCPSVFKNSHLPMTGINTRISYNGTYLISNVWWSNSYKTLSNCGGNKNSIGMESEVGENANLEATWHHIAQLCADIIVRRNLALGLDAICQHNTFSGKNCPQTMREAGRWEYFKKMAEAEYYARKYMQDFEVQLICSSEYVNSFGQVIKFPDAATTITYQVRVTSSKYNYDQTTQPIEVIIPAKLSNN